MENTVPYPLDAHVTGIAITSHPKGANILPGNDFFSLKYFPGPVKKPYVKDQSYDLHCKIFNPGYPYLALSALMHTGTGIGIETHLARVEDLNHCLVYPKVTDEDERRAFQTRNLAEVCDSFPFQDTKKYFFYKKFQFDDHYPFFYDPEDQVTILLRIGVSETGGTGAAWKILPEQQFTWELKSVRS